MKHISIKNKYGVGCFKHLMGKEQARDEAGSTALIKGPSQERVLERVMGSRELALPPLTKPANIYIMYT